MAEINMNRIKEVLRKQGRTQIWLAEQIGKSYAVVTNYCNNNSQPSVPVLRAIAVTLDVDVRDLLIPTKEHDKLTMHDIDIIITSLTHSRDHIRDNANEPTYKAKMDRVGVVEDVLSKMRNFKRDE